MPYTAVLARQLVVTWAMMSSLLSGAKPVRPGSPERAALIGRLLDEPILLRVRWNATFSSSVSRRRSSATFARASVRYSARRRWTEVTLGMGVHARGFRVLATVLLAASCLAPAEA